MKKSKLFASLALSVFALGMPFSASVKADEMAPVNDQVPIYRLYNKNTGEHFYTPSSNELISLQTAGWTSEGIGWYAPSAGDPVYRIYNPNAKGGDHYYTMNKAEADYNVSLGWKWDNNGKPTFYSGGKIADYVAYNPNADSGAHNYTTDLNEQNNLLNVGWIYGAVAWQATAAGTNSINADQIVKKNTATIQGLWKNDQGDTLKIIDDQLILNGKNLNGGTFTDLWSGVEKGTYGSVSFPLNYETGRALIILPAGIVVGNDDKSNYTVDRIVIGQDATSTQHAFYRA
ncbi:DUF6287 domain-containing protein [Lactovum odontotermitis]